MQRTEDAQVIEGKRQDRGSRYYSGCFDGRAAQLIRGTGRQKRGRQDHADALRHEPASYCIGSGTRGRGKYDELACVCAREKRRRIHARRPSTGAGLDG